MSHIMLIDDQPYMYEILSEDLADNGHRLTYVEEADESMEKIRESRPDIVLLDLYLQGFIGWDLLREIKHDYPALPVLILSAYDTFKNDPRTASADGYVVKDFRTDGLIGKINYILNERKRENTPVGRRPG